MTERRTILFSTTNPHKIREVQEILSPLGFELKTLDDFRPLPPEPVEDADTFAGNARIKARAYAKFTGVPCLAEDSGLEVDALGGAPGVHSARYAGTSGSRAERDLANNEKVLRELSRVPAADRTARFVCAMCLAAPDGEILAETRGTYDGVIGTELRGSNGFGYDPLLLLPDLGKTSAELSSDEKNERSHRGRAARALVELLSSKTS